MVSKKAPSLLALAVFGLLVSSSFASNVASAMAPANGVVPQDGQAYCEVMAPCNVPKCTLLCLRQDLDSELGFCTLKPDFQVYCCCRVPDSEPPLRLSATTN
ncbi:hypothetical protein EJB05_19252, partial [Eragrostis curvula]